MPASSCAVEQDSPLVKLPAELKNRIFELAMPANTVIAIRAESADSKRSLWSVNHQPPAHAHLSYKYKPTAPPILSVCREFRRDASAMYYGSNIFLFSDVALQPKALEGFVAARGQATLSAIRTASVSHQYTVIKPMVARRDSQQFTLEEWDDRPMKDRLGQLAKVYCMSFRLDHGPEGAVLSMIRSRERHPEDVLVEEALFDSDGLCCCKLEALAADREKVSTQGSGTVLAVLHAYAEAVSEYQVRRLADRSDGGYFKVMKSEDIVAQVCERCRKVKSI